MSAQYLAALRSGVGWAGFLPRWAFDHLSDWLGYYGAGPEAHRAKYMSQHALAFSADAYGGARYVMWGIENRPELLDMSTYAQIREGDVVWIRIEDLARFNREILPRTHARFVLVTAESDYRVPSDFPGPAAEIARSGKLLCWFATNYDGTAHRELIRPLPLGMNYRKKHDLHWIDGEQGRRLLRRERLPVAAQERGWEAVAAAAAPIDKRLPLAFADFWLNNSSQERRYGESRADIRAQLAENRNVAFPPRLVDHPTLLSNYARHAFVISPHGRGLDCYRTWEALFVGCIVIVKRSPLDGLYRDLPVVIVDDWREITAAALQGWMQRFGDTFDRRPLARFLSLQTWVDAIRAARLAS